MKNLKCILSADFKIANICGSYCVCVSSDENFNSYNNSGSIYFYTDAKLFGIHGKTEKLFDIYDLQIHYVHNNSVDIGGVGLEYNFLSKSLILALANGDVFSYNLESEEMECIGSVESGCKSMAWSPDFETVVFCTGLNTLILMSGSFDPIIEVNLLATDYGINKMVNVGWGKKETQFHGSEGKGARITQAIEGSKNINDDKLTRISWRGDSTLFVTSFWIESECKREIKIFDQRGILQCNAELLPGLGQSIVWRPSGNLIAVTQRLPNKYIVSFIEKNGLAHGNFILPSNIEVIELSMNIDSTILCVQCESKVLLYSFSNYHYYLKQQIEFTSPILFIKWDVNIPNHLHVFKTDGSYSIYQWSWTINRTESLTDGDAGLVAVIDGCDINLTPFKYKTIPPPMCDQKITFSAPIKEIVFAPSVNENSATIKNCNSGMHFNVNNFFVYMGNNKLSHFDYSRGKITNEFIIKNMKLDNLHHFLWLKEDILICCGIKPEKKYYFCELKIDVDGITCVKTIKMENAISNVCTSSTGDSVIMFITCNGDLFMYFIGSKELASEVGVLPDPCYENRVYGSIMFSLSEMKRLYVNSTLLSSKATSFFVYFPYLLTTTTDHKLQVFKIHGETKVDEICTRRLERGAKIVTAVNDKLILQMPRGNLETIQPRVLIIHTSKPLIDKCDYGKVFNIFRKNRINLNLIIDHQPQRFISNVTTFLLQVNDPSDVTLFLSELADVDVTQDLYKDYYIQQGRPPILKDKVNSICVAFRTCMSVNNDKKMFYLNAIITTYIKTNEMDEALKLAFLHPICLKQLLVLVDVDKLYDCALMLYNLEMAMRIAEKSNKDPNEYVPYLNNLKNMDVDYMKYTLDCKFKKYESALRHISRSCDEIYFEEALIIIENNKLYPLALSLYNKTPKWITRLTDLYCEYLLSKNHYGEAAILYARCGNYHAALEAYVKEGSWRKALIMAKKIGFACIDVKALGERIFSILKGKKLWIEAASVADEILNDYELVIECFIEARLWDQAIYYSTKISNKNIDTNIKRGIEDETISLMEMLNFGQEKLKKYSSRLVEVRLQKTKNNESVLTDIDTSDIQSDISSVSSGSSRSSRTGRSKSSKIARKMEKMMWSLKEGNPREEFALLAEISKNIKDLECLTEDVSKCCKALLFYNEAKYDALASNLEINAEKAVLLSHDLRNTVWPIQPNENEIDINVQKLDNKYKFAPSSYVKSLWSCNFLRFYDDE